MFLRGNDLARVLLGIVQKRLRPRLPRGALDLAIHALEERHELRGEVARDLAVALASTLGGTRLPDGAALRAVVRLDAPQVGLIGAFVVELVLCFLEPRQSADARPLLALDATGPRRFAFLAGDVRELAEEAPLAL